MVAAAHPLAADAALEILRAGGSALDAAIAAQMVLGLVEPQSSGIGGGAFLMHFDGGKRGEVQAWDGRETAPAAAHEDLFLRADGRPVPFDEAVLGGRAVATPGLLRMLQAAHRLHGVLPWAKLFEPAIALAEAGFAMGPRLHSLLLTAKALRQDPQARAYFFAADGLPHPIGHRLRNPALAAVLRAVARQGAEALHAGPLAADLVARVHGHATPGGLSLQDLSGYRPVRRAPLCTLWRTVYRVCGAPPPSSGHLAVMQILGTLEQGEKAYRLDASGAPDAESLHHYTEAARLAFADRALYVADPDFVPAPAGDWAALLQPGYLAQRAALIAPRAMTQAPAGRPSGASVAWAPMPDQPEHGTSHLSVVDAQGRAVALTTSIEAAFGARIMADGGTGLPGGYLLNNQMTDFSLMPTDAAGRPVANRVQPGKRPRSSMAPTLIFDARSGELLMSLGSPGGPFIVHFVARTLLAALPGRLSLQQAIDGPNFGTLGGPVLLEEGRFAAATLDDLRARGHRVVQTGLPSGLHAIGRAASAAGYEAGADPRREGVARGD